MNHFNPQTEIAPSVLATDLDGTLIPLPNSERNHKDLHRVKELFTDSKSTLVYATGRHFESVVEAMNEYDLPSPEWIVCDVGSAIYRHTGERYEVFEKYETHLSETSGGLDRKVIEQALQNIEGLVPQPADHQGHFKISYQSEADTVEALVELINEKLKVAKLPYDCMGSLDPFLNCGLIDVMPAGVSKAYALLWLSTHADFSPHEVIYSGDSGNDYAALVSGFRSIIVANGSQGLEAKVRARLKARGLEHRLYIAKGTATSGVLEGCKHFGLL
ncbi:HAD-IIB family hydrolase [Coraliomargarita sp. W4R72]